MFQKMEAHEAGNGDKCFLERAGMKTLDERLEIGALHQSSELAGRQMEKQYIYPENDYKEDKDNFKRYAEVKSILLYGKPGAEPPRLSVVIPTFRRPEKLKRAIDSVLSQKKIGVAYELVIVDSDNTHAGVCHPFISGTEALVKTYPENAVLYYQNEQNIGMFGNWNRCFELARASWVAMLHDDDMLAEGYFEQVSGILEELEKQEDVALVKGKSLPAIDGKAARRKKFGLLYERMCYGKIVEYFSKDYAILGPEKVGVFGEYSCGSLVNKKIYMKYGGTDESHFPCADAYYLERLVTKHQFRIFLSADIWGYADEDGNATQKEEVLLGDALEYMVYRQYYAQRDRLSGLMFSFFHKEMLFECQKSLFLIAGRNREIDMEKFRGQVEEIMGTVKCCGAKRHLYRALQIGNCRYKQVKRLFSWRIL